MLLARAFTSLVFLLAQAPARAGTVEILKDLHSRNPIQEKRALREIVEGKGTSDMVSLIVQVAERRDAVGFQDPETLALCVDAIGAIAKTDRTAAARGFLKLAPRSVTTRKAAHIQLLGMQPELFALLQGILLGPNNSQDLYCCLYFLRELAVTNGLIAERLMLRPLGMALDSESVAIVSEGAALINKRLKRGQAASFFHPLKRHLLSCIEHLVPRSLTHFTLEGSQLSYVAAVAGDVLGVDPDLLKTLQKVYRTVQSKFDVAQQTLWNNLIRRAQGREALDLDYPLHARTTLETWLEDPERFKRAHAYDAGIVVTMLGFLDDEQEVKSLVQAYVTRFGKLGFRVALARLLSVSPDEIVKRVALADRDCLALLNSRD